MTANAKNIKKGAPMADHVTNGEQDGAAWSAEAMRQRRVRYAELRPCYNAFIDSRTPGSDAKENFTIIGPGVSENEEQFVHIAEPHGYNIGGARQPPGCVNSQHSHRTAEVFVAHSGRWRFDLGEDAQDAHLYLSPGDVISIPTNVFRGFTNVGEGEGFLWAVLGQDDPGRVTWAPKVFDMAEAYGLVLMESGKLIDTRDGQVLPEGGKRMPPPSPSELEAMQRVTDEEAKAFVWRAQGREGSSREAVIAANGHFSWPHGFTLERLVLAASERFAAEPHDGSSVIFIDDGAVELAWREGQLELGRGDTFSVPEGVQATLNAADHAVVFIVRQGDAEL